MSLYVITGTDTGVGKTHLAVRLLAALRARGIDANGLKPIETGWRAESSDASQLAAASSRPLAETIWGHFSLAAAPSIAARAEDRDIHLPDLVGWIRGWSGPLTLLEGAGGWLVPISDDFLFRDLVTQLHPSGVLLVTSGRLGTINHTLLSAESIKASGCRLVAVVMSASPDLEALYELQSRIPEPVLLSDDLDQILALFHVEQH